MNLFQKTMVQFCSKEKCFFLFTYSINFQHELVELMSKYESFFPINLYRILLMTFFDVFDYL